MLTKYYFIRDVSHINTETVIFRLFVGESKREQDALRELSHLSSFTGSALILYSEEVAETLWKIGEKLFIGARCPIIHFRSKEIRVCDLVSKIRKKELVAYEGTIRPSRYYFQALSVLENEIFVANMIKNEKIYLPTGLRKYLSHSEHVLKVKACVSYAIVVIIFLIAGYIEGHVNF